MEPGEIWPFAFPTGDRPGLVVEADWVARLRLETVRVVPLTTREHRQTQATCVFIPRAETGLDHDSTAVCHLLASIDRDGVLGSELWGRVDDDTLDRVRLVVAHILGSSAETFMADEE